MEELKAFMAKKDLAVQLKNDGYRRLVLRQNYGRKIESAFGMSRQGVRWRFQRLADCYVSALETIYFVETHLGPELRPLALEIAKERVELRRQSQKLGPLPPCRRQAIPEQAISQGSQK